MTFPGLLALLATLALRMEAGEAEWLAASLLQATVHLRTRFPRMPGTSRWPGRLRPPAHASGQLIIQPHGC